MTMMGFELFLAKVIILTLLGVIALLVLVIIILCKQNGNLISKIIKQEEDYRQKHNNRED